MIAIRSLSESVATAVSTNLVGRVLFCISYASPETIIKHSYSCNTTPSFHTREGSSHPCRC